MGEEEEPVGSRQPTLLGVHPTHRRAVDHSTSHRGESRARQSKKKKRKNRDMVDDFPYGHVVLLSHLMSNNTSPGPGLRFYRGATCQALNNQLEITLCSRV